MNTQALFCSRAFHARAAAMTLTVTLATVIAGANAVASPNMTPNDLGSHTAFTKMLTQSRDESARTLVSLDVPWEPDDVVLATATLPPPPPEPEPEEVLEEVPLDLEVGPQASSTHVEDQSWVAAQGGNYSHVDTGDVSRDAIVGLALEQVGKPYVWAATGPDAFDCSGLVYYVFGQNGISLPRMSGDQGASGRVVSYGEALPGDLVVWGQSHIAIYLGDGMIVHASTPATGVKISPLYGDYYFSRILD